jgi:hypothetical protein
LLDFLIGPYLLPRRLSAQVYWVFLEEKLPETCGSSFTGLRLIFYGSSENISPQLTIAGMRGAGLWLGLPGHRTSFQWTSSYESTLKPWFTRHHLILKRVLFPVPLRQQLRIFERTRQSLLRRRRLCIEVGEHLL